MTSINDLPIRNTRFTLARRSLAKTARIRGTFLFLFSFLFSVSTLSAVKRGDVDEDGKGTIFDIVILNNHRLGISTLPNDLEQFGDVDEDGSIDQDDVAAGVNAILGLAELPDFQFTRVFETSPQDGESGVAVTRETILRLTGPLADDAMIDDDNLFAEFAGQRIPARIHISKGKRTVTLFYDEILPSSARVRVTLIGDAILDGRGLTIDPEEDGDPGGTLKFDFDTLSLTVIPGTAVCGRVFASELAVDEEGFMSVNVPLEGVTVTVDGMEELSAVTDAFGDFRLEPVPAGIFFVHIDGGTATNGVPAGAYYPFVGKAWESVPGEETNIGEVYLPLIVDGTLQAVSDVDDTEISVASSVSTEFPEYADVSITVPAGSLFSDDGTTGGFVGIAPVPPDRLPGELPEGLAFPIVFTVQTDGATNFDEPVSACFPNLPDPETGDLLAPGEKSALWSFDHDKGRFEIVGSMTVTGDGTQVCTDPGVGILAPGWHGNQQGTQVEDGRTETIEPNPLVLGFPTGTQECKKDHRDADCVCIDGKWTWRGSETHTEGAVGAVLLHSGEERLDRVDLAIPGRGDLHFRMQRRYRSQMDFDGPLGFGWDFTYNESIFVQLSGDVIRMDGGSHIDTWQRNLDGSFTPPDGQFRQLIEQSDGTYVLRSPNGFQRFYRRDGRLFCYQDRFGNRMLFDYDPRGNLHRVVDVYGREIEFIFDTLEDGVDRLEMIRDFIGREVVYSYDERGDLVTVRTPVVTGSSTGNDFPEGRTERYAYSSGFADAELNHNLLELYFPEEVAKGGPPVFSWTYGSDPADPLTFDKVVAQTKGGTNDSGIPAAGTTTYDYVALNEGEPANQPDLPRGMVTITERNGNMKEFYVNEFQQHILTRRLTRGFRPSEPAFYETQSFFDGDGQLVRRIYPEGNEVQLTYDTAGPRGQQQNVIEIRRIADASRGGGEDLVETMTYEPLYNQTASVTDPRGNAVGFVPPLGAASAARYTTTFFYDYQESNQTVEQAEVFGIDLASVSRNLGDLNSDAKTDQVAGNLVRVAAPSVVLRADANEAQRLGSTTQAIINEIQWNDHGQRLAVIDAEGNVTDYGYNPENDPDGDGQTVSAVYKPLSADPIGYLRSMVVDSRTSARRSAAADPVMLTTEYQYDPVGNLVGVQNPRGVLTAIELNQLNEPVVITRGAGVSVANANGQLLTDESPFAYRMRSHYDSNGRVVLTETENRDGNTQGVGDYVERTITYDLLNNPVKSTVEVDAQTVLETQFRYDENELSTLVIQPEGNEVQTIYDERNLPFLITRGFGSPDASTVQVNYDRNANQSEFIDAEDNDGDPGPEVTTTVYDGFDRISEVVDPLGNRRVTEYDVASRPIHTEVFGHPAGQPNGANVLLAEAFYRLDELNRTYQVDQKLFLAGGFNPIRAVQLLDENSDGFVTDQIEYDALSRTTFTIEDDLEERQRVYDGASRPIETIDALGNRRLTDYDQNSNPVQTTSIEVPSPDLDPQVPDEQFVTHYVYDQLDRLGRATDNAGQTTRFTYDSRDNLVAQSDPLGDLMDDPLGLFPGPSQSGQINHPGNTRSYVYDGLDRRIQSIYDLRQNGQGGQPLDLSSPFNPDGQVTVTYEFDGNSRLTGMIDDNGNLTGYAYDDLNRRTDQTNADLTQYLFQYDRDDNGIHVTDPNGSVISRTYDVLNRLVQTDVNRAQGVGGTIQETYAYDGLSRLTQSTDDNGSVDTLQTCEYIFDSLSRRLEEQQNGRPISSVYAGDGRRLSCTYPGGRMISTTFDAIDRPKTVSDVSGLIGQCFYIGGAMRELKRALGNNTVLSFLDDAGTQIIGYDAVKRVSRMRHLSPDGTSPFLDREYSYNRASRRTSEKRNEDFALQDTYTYDSLYRVLNTDLDTAGMPGAIMRDQSQIGYQLDGVGNRRQVDTNSISTGPQSDLFAANEMNEYTNIDGVDRQHSDNGNLTDDGTRTFGYDYRNRLVSVVRKSDGTPIADYHYYADNRRSRKVAFDLDMPGEVEAETQFFYDGWQVSEEQDESNNPQITFVYGASHIDEVVQFERTTNHSLGADAFYAHQNARADVAAITDSGGNVVETRFYDDFGQGYDENKQQVQSSAVGNPYGFQGRRLDAETGLYYFRNRYYDPQAGRFLQRDPVWDAANLGNQYTFAANGPISSRDPDGSQSEDSVSYANPDLAYLLAKWANIDWTRHKPTGSYVAVIEKLETEIRHQSKMTARSLWEQEHRERRRKNRGVVVSGHFGIFFGDLFTGGSLTRGSFYEEEVELEYYDWGRGFASNGPEDYDWGPGPVLNDPEEEIADIPPDDPGSETEENAPEISGPITKTFIWSFQRDPTECGKWILQIEESE